MADTYLVFSEDNGEKIYIELESNKNDYGYRSGEGEERAKEKEAETRFAQAISTVKTLANNVLDQICEFAESPHEVELNMGVKFSATGNAFIAKTSADATLNLRIMWSKESIEKAVANKK